MHKHELKSWVEFFRLMLAGEKKHDLRRFDDRLFRVGDEVLYREWDPRKERYTGRHALAKITYLTAATAPCALSGEALDPKFCILSVEILTHSDDVFDQSDPAIMLARS